MGLIKFIFNKILGWKVEGKFDPTIKKSVVIVAPHTSWHDFYVGAFARKQLGIPIHYVGKKELFRPPFGWYFRWMGGTPLDRTPGQNKVESIAAVFEDKEEFRLTLAPEGTRKKVEEWKSGFYYIACKAGVPIVPVSFDYPSKTVTVHPEFYPTGDYAKDAPKIQSFYKGVVGKVPEFT